MRRFDDSCVRALQAIGCLGTRVCHTNNCPVGIATQKPGLRQRPKIEKQADQLTNSFRASTELMPVMVCAWGQDRLNEFCIDDLTNFDRENAHLTDSAPASLRTGSICLAEATIEV